MFLSLGGFLTGKVILVIDDLAVIPLLADALAAVPPLFLLTIPVSGILIDVCDTCILVENLNNLGCVPLKFPSQLYLGIR